MANLSSYKQLNTVGAKIKRSDILGAFTGITYFSLTVKAATLIFISGCVSAISSAKEGKSGFIYNLVNS